MPCVCGEKHSHGWKIASEVLREGVNMCSSLPVACNSRKRSLNGARHLLDISKTIHLPLTRSQHMDIIKIALRHKQSHINNAKRERAMYLTCLFTGGKRRPREGRSDGEGFVSRNTVLGMGFMSLGLWGGPLLTKGSLYILAKRKLAGVEEVTSASPAEYADHLCSDPKSSPRCWPGQRFLIDFNISLDELNTSFSPGTVCWCVPWHKAQFWLSGHVWCSLCHSN